MMLYTGITSIYFRTTFTTFNSVTVFTSLNVVNIIDLKISAGNKKIIKNDIADLKSN